MLFRRKDRHPGARPAPPLSTARARSFETLEGRRLLSASAFDAVAVPAFAATPTTSTSTVSGLTPAQVRKAYGFDQVAFGDGTVRGDGAGQTLAIVSAYHDPNIAADLAVFDRQFGIAPPPRLTVVDQAGGTNYPPADAGWASETALDVEWAHVMAPSANLLVVEANSARLSDLVQAVDYARHVPGVSAVSMSWGAGEFPQEAPLDDTFTTPAGHGGVTFVAASGDGGSWGGASWPAVSPNVVAVGGTSLTLADAAGTYGGEVGWAGSGGGTSRFEPAPSYQAGVAGAAADKQPFASARPTNFDPFARRPGASDGHDRDSRASRGNDTESARGDAPRGERRFVLEPKAPAPTAGRSTPDVSFNADPVTGFAVYNSFAGGAAAGWTVVGGTSAGAPQWAALVIVANQGRTLAGSAPLDGATQTLPMLYRLGGPARVEPALHDVTDGDSSPFVSAAAGYDRLAGLGTPYARGVISGLGGHVATLVFRPAIVIAPPGAAAPASPGSQPAAAPVPASTATPPADHPDQRPDAGASRSQPAPDKEPDAPAHLRRHNARAAATSDRPDAVPAAPSATNVPPGPAQALAAAGDAAAAMIVASPAGPFSEVPFREAAPLVAHLAGSRPVLAAGFTGGGVSPASVGGASAGAAAVVGGAAVQGVKTVAAALSDFADALTGDTTGRALGAARSGMLHLPAGPALLLGLAPSAGGWTRASWWPSPRVWRLTEAVSLVVAVAGYGYCRAESDRKKILPAARPSGIRAARRPAEGL